MSTGKSSTSGTPASEAEIVPGPVEDAEVICGWMEPKHQTIPLDDLQWHGVRYRDGNLEYCDRKLTLDALWEVEERLIQRCTSGEAALGKYTEALTWACDSGQQWHATAQQKIKALAAVIRSAPPASNPSSD